MMGYFFDSIFGTVDVGLHALAVAHRHHHFALDDGDRFEFFFDSVAASYSVLVLRLSESRETRKACGA